ncbi:MAG: hypothetical protein JSS34_00710 [Proteobacteria bacterium]|nr:hypothetical protein [Pseudomonadota bacterium]
MSYINDHILPQKNRALIEKISKDFPLPLQLTIEGVQIQYADIISFENWSLRNGGIPDPDKFLPLSKPVLTYFPSTSSFEKEDDLTSFVFSYCQTRASIYDALSDYEEVKRSANYFFYHDFRSKNKEFQKTINVMMRMLGLFATQSIDKAQHSPSSQDTSHLYFSLQILHRLSNIPPESEEDKIFQFHDRLCINYARLFQETGNESYHKLATSYLKRIPKGSDSYIVTEAFLKNIKTKNKGAPRPKREEVQSAHASLARMVQPFAEEGDVRAKITLFSMPLEQLILTWSPHSDITSFLDVLQTFEKNIADLSSRKSALCVDRSKACAAEDPSASKEASLKELYEFFCTSTSEKNGFIILGTILSLTKGGAHKEALERLDATQHHFHDMESSIKLLRAQIKNFMGEPEDLYLLMLETQAEKRAYLKKKQEERHTRNVKYYTQIREHLKKFSEHALKDSQKLTSRASSVKPEILPEKRMEASKAAASPSVFLSGTTPTRVDDKEKKKRNHAKREAEREAARQRSLNAAAAEAENVDEEEEDEEARRKIELQHLLENDPRTILDLYGDVLTTSARQVEEKISANNWDISREEFERYFISLGCTKEGGKGSHQKLALPDSVAYIYNGRIITILTSTLPVFEGGSVILPNIDKVGFVKFYLRDQILAAREELRKLAILKEIHNPNIRNGQ